MGFISGMHRWLNIQKLMNVMHHIYEGRRKKTTLSSQCRKSTRQNSTPFHYKDTQQNKDRRKLPQHNKAIFEKPTVNIILSSERPRTFLLRSGTRQGCLLLPLPEARAKPIKQEKEIKGIQIEKKEVTLSLFTDDVIFF